MGAKSSLTKARVIRPGYIRAIPRATSSLIGEPPPFVSMDRAREFVEDMLAESRPEERTRLAIREFKAGRLPIEQLAYVENILDNLIDDERLALRLRGVSPFENTAQLGNLHDVKHSLRSFGPTLNPKELRKLKQEFHSSWGNSNDLKHDIADQLYAIKQRITGKDAKAYHVHEGYATDSRGRDLVPSLYKGNRFFKDMIYQPLDTASLLYQGNTQLPTVKGWRAHARGETFPITSERVANATLVKDTAKKIATSIKSQGWLGGKETSPYITEFDIPKKAVVGIGATAEHEVLFNPMLAKIAKVVGPLSIVSQLVEFAKLKDKSLRDLMFDTLNVSEETRKELDRKYGGT